MLVHSEIVEKVMLFKKILKLLTFQTELIKGYFYEKSVINFVLGFPPPASYHMIGVW